MTAHPDSGLRDIPFRATLAATVLGFGGYALLLPVVPLWVARGGSGAAGAGATTGVLMLVTVLTQLGVPWLLHRVGHRAVLAGGMTLLSAPTPLLALSADLGPVLAVSAVRGVGFGLLTVAGSALVAELVEPAAHGRAGARYGYAVGLPQLALLPAGVGVVDVLGFPAVFVAGGVAPLLGVLLVPWIRVGARPPGTATAVSGPEPALTRAGTATHPADGVSPPAVAGPARPPSRRRSGAPAVLAMLLCSVAQGGLITFLPLAAGPAAVAAALFGTAAGALLGRGLAGNLVDRCGLGGRLLAPAMILAAFGMAAEVAAVGTGSAALVVAGAVAVGIGFGVVQNDALTTLFAVTGPAGYGSASAAWNIAYDAGTGIGASGLGAIAEPFGFAAAFGVSGAVLLLAAPFTWARRPGCDGPRRRRATGGRG